MKIISWNVNGLQGVLKTPADVSSDKIIKNKKMTTDNPLQSLVEQYQPNFLCLQEIKTCKTIDIKSYVPGLCNYKIYWNQANTDRGYSGTMIATNLKPIGVFYNFPKDIIEYCDKEYGSSTRLNIEGRLIALYFADFTLLNVYSPNTGFGLKRLKERIQWWELALRTFTERLQTGIRVDDTGHRQQQRRKVIIVGDLNVIPDLELDRRALQYQDGSTKEERECFRMLLQERKLVDAYRYLHPKDKMWTWVPPKLWDKNVMGCRIDFVLVDEDDINKVKEFSIIVHRGSDHRPIMTVIDE